MNIYLVNIPDSALLVAYLLMCQISLCIHVNRITYIVMLQIITPITKIKNVISVQAYTMIGLIFKFWGHSIIIKYNLLIRVIVK